MPHSNRINPTISLRKSPKAVPRLFENRIVQPIKKLLFFARMEIQPGPSFLFHMKSG